MTLVCAKCDEPPLKGRRDSSGSLSYRMCAAFLALMVLSGWVRFRLADLSDWGVDESAVLWLGSKILRLVPEPLGLPSSIGIRQPAGGALLAAPFALLPDLLSVSRGLALCQMAVLSGLAYAIGRSLREKTYAASVLLFYPALVLASINLWDKYFTVWTAAAAMLFFLTLLSGRGGPVFRACLICGWVGVALFEPALHIISFADLPAEVLLLATVLTLRPQPLSRAAAALGLAGVGAGAGLLYAPWFLALFGRPARVTLLAAIAGGILLSVVCAVGFAAVRRGTPQAWLNGALPRLESSRVLSWGVLITLCVCLAACAVPSLAGAQAGRRLVAARDPLGLTLLVGQVMVSLGFMPSLVSVARLCVNATPCGELIRHCFGRHAVAGALLVLHAGLQVAGRLVLAPTLLWPWGRADFIISLMPAMLGPLILLFQGTASPRGRNVAQLTVALPVAALILLALFGPSRSYRLRYPHIVPPSEMRAAVDWIADRHRGAGGGGTIDLRYDLAKGREWVAAVSGRPGLSWYSLGRGYDWLLLRRHGLVTGRAGEDGRLDGAELRIGYRDDPGAGIGLPILLQLDRIEVRGR